MALKLEILAQTTPLLRSIQSVFSNKNVEYKPDLSWTVTNQLKIDPSKDILAVIKEYYKAGRWFQLAILANDYINRIQSGQSFQDNFLTFDDWVFIRFISLFRLGEKEILKKEFNQWINLKGLNNNNNNNSDTDRDHHLVSEPDEKIHPRFKLIQLLLSFEKFSLSSSCLSILSSSTNIDYEITIIKKLTHLLHSFLPIFNEKSPTENQNLFFSSWINEIITWITQISLSVQGGQSILQALVQYNKQIKSSTLYGSIIKIYLSLGENHQAKQLLDQFDTVNRGRVDDWVIFWMCSALYYFYEGSYDKAIQYLTQIISDTQDSIEAQNFLAVIELYQRKPVEALERLNELTINYPNTVALYWKSVLMNLFPLVDLLLNQPELHKLSILSRLIPFLGDDVSFDSFFQKK